MKLLTLPNGLRCVLGNYSVHQDTIFHRRKDNRNVFVLRFDELNEGHGPNEISSKSAVCLTNTNFDWLLFETKGAKIRSLKVQISEEWLNDFLKQEPAGGEQIRKFLALTTSSFNYEPMDKEYKLLLNHVLHPDCDERFHLLYQQNRVMLLVERFFTNLSRRMSGLSEVPKMGTTDIQRIREAEEILLQDLTKAVSIDQLSKRFMISQSKLKDGFKELYGMTVYQYFQKHRMQKAKAMLVSRKYTVRQVSTQLGYESMNSFTKAFQKVFDQLPSEVNNDALV
jgi:AraC-like DNA-binding protein